MTDTAQTMNTPALLIRPSTLADLPAITAIYAHAVLHGTGTFEIEAPDEAEMARRRDDVLSKGLPWLVAQAGDQVLGYAYANHFRPRRAYRFCLENSIYLAAQTRGQGLGRLLLTELVGRCEAAGWKFDRWLDVVLMQRSLGHGHARPAPASDGLPT